MAVSSTDTTDVATGSQETMATSPTDLREATAGAQGHAAEEVTETVGGDQGGTETEPEPRGEAAEPQLNGTGGPSGAEGDAIRNAIDDSGGAGQDMPISAQDGDGARKGRSSGKAKNPEIELVRPSGASELVHAYIDLAETVIQRAVELLGKGMPELPPDVAELLQPQEYQALGEGEAAETYKETLSRVEAKKTELQQMDSQVQQASATVAGKQEETLRIIGDIADKLNTTLEAVDGVDLKPAQETKLMDHIAKAVEAVYTEIENASQINSEMAGEDGNAGGTPGSGDGGQGGGGQGGGGQGGGLQSLLPMLAMAPMALMPLATQLLPELLDQGNEEGEQKDGEQGKPGEPPADPNAPPADPNAPPPEGDPAVQAAPPQGEPPAGQDQPDPNSPTPAIPSPGTLV